MAMARVHFVLFFLLFILRGIVIFSCDYFCNLSFDCWILGFFLIAFKMYLNSGQLRRMQLMNDFVMFYYLFFT